MEEQLIYETLKQYTLYIGQLDLTVHARISKSLTTTGELDFEWSVSHYLCKADRPLKKRKNFCFYI